MSKPDYKKEIMDSLKEGAIITGVTIGGYMTLKVPLQDLTPSAKLDINDAGKLGLGIYRWSSCEGLRREKNGLILYQYKHGKHIR